MWKRYLWFKNLIFLCFFSYLLARIGNTILLAHLPSFQPDLGQGSPAGYTEARKAEKKTLRLYRPISERNVFNSASTGEKKNGESKKAGESNAPLKKADLSVELIGTVVGVSEDSFAIIEDRQSRQQELYQVDDMIQDQVRVVAISRCKVVVLREGTQEVIECPEPDADKGMKTSAARYPGSPSPAGDASYNVKKVSESEYVVDEQEVENALGNINQLLTQIRVVPNFQDGKADGFKVFAIKPESIFAKVGLQNGDVIRKVNDQDITSPEKAFQVFQQLRNEKNLSVEISRRGQTQSLSYEIR